MRPQIKENKLDRWTPIHCALFLCANIADGITTSLALSVGAFEGNFIPSFFTVSMTGFFIYKIVLTYGIIAVLLLINKTRWLNLASFFLIVFSVWNLLVWKGIV